MCARFCCRCRHRVFPTKEGRDVDRKGGGEDEWRKEGEKEGRKIGRRERRKEGRKEKRKEKRKEGRKEGSYFASELVVVGTKSAKKEVVISPLVNTSDATICCSSARFVFTPLKRS
jgi:hypothetical protein